MARQVLPAVGAIVGFWITGTPQGAMWGYSTTKPAMGKARPAQVLPAQERRR